MRARTGAPLRLTFDRREDGDCSARVVFPDLGVNRFLAPFASTTVDVPTDQPGTFDFACGMNMIHGQLVIEGEPAASGQLPPSFAFSARKSRQASFFCSGWRSR